MAKVRMYAGQRYNKQCLKICKKTKNNAETVTESVKFMMSILEIEQETLEELIKEYRCEMNCDMSLYPIIYGKKSQLNKIIKRLEPWILAYEMR